MRKVILSSIAVALTLSSDFSMGCTVFESAQSRIPLNSVNIPNADRVRIAEIVIRARNWPDTQIRGVVQPRAYDQETDRQSLLERRGANLKNYLLQLGVKEENIWMEPLVVNESETLDARGKPDISQLNVTLYPICEGGCDRLCNDRRVTPVSKAIK